MKKNGIEELIVPYLSQFSISAHFPIVLYGYGLPEYQYYLETPRIWKTEIDFEHINPKILVLLVCIYHSEKKNLWVQVYVYVKT